MKAKPKILIVDDKPENLVALRTVLKNLDILVVEATSGNEALKKTLHHDFALALLDIKMPGMDGYELAKILREEEKTAHLPFIFISAVYTDNTDVFKGYEKGAFSFITKPFQPEILINKVKFFIDRHHQEIALSELNKELKNKNEELAFQNDEKEKRTMDLIIANKELEQFSYIASHDLQEPLRTVSNYMKLFEEDYLGILDENAGKYLLRVNNAIKRMSILIKALLDFSRLGHNTKLTFVNFKKLIGEVITDLDTLIKSSNAVIEVTKMPELNVFEIEIHQVFKNLITNAIKFRANDTRPEIQIHSEKMDEKWKFSVTDNGIGIAPEHFERIFDIFQRLHPYEEYEGYGIGLANCKKIVQLHQGKIWVESNQATRETTFYFTIPNLII
ncbi:MAG: ATP-binding protein [Ferruginibacter sp.]